MVEDVSEIKTSVCAITEDIQNVGYHRGDMLKMLALDALRDKLVDYIKRKNLKTYRKSVLEFVLIVLEVYEYVKSDEKCTVGNVVEWFEVEDEELIKHALQFIELNYRIGPGHELYEKYNYPSKS